jgi:hypothetical protein
MLLLLREKAKYLDFNLIFKHIEDALFAKNTYFVHISTWVKYFRATYNQSINQSINQPTNQSIIQSIWYKNVYSSVEIKYNPDSPIRF